MAPDPWLSQYDAACQLAQEVAERIQERSRHRRNGESSAKLNVIIRSSLQNLKEKIDQLKDSLLRAVSTHQITQLEGDRRQNLVDDLLTRQKQLQASYKNEGTEPDVIRSSLMAGGVKRGVTNPWLLEESEETRGLGFDDIRQQQRRIIEEQDAGLDALSSIISRQKQMGQEIGNELDEQNEIIDDLTNLVENTDSKLRTQTRHVKMVDRKSTSCGGKNVWRGKGPPRLLLSVLPAPGCILCSTEPPLAPAPAPTCSTVPQHHPCLYTARRLQLPSVSFSPAPPDGNAIQPPPAAPVPQPLQHCGSSWP